MTTHTPVSGLSDSSPATSSAGSKPLSTDEHLQAIADAELTMHQLLMRIQQASAVVNLVAETCTIDRRWGDSALQGAAVLLDEAHQLGDSLAGGIVGSQHPTCEGFADLARVIRAKRDGRADEILNALHTAAAKQGRRRFSGAAPTGFGELS